MGKLANTDRPAHKRDRTWRLAALLLTLLVSSLGCTPGMLGALLMPFSDNLNEPACLLTVAGKESKVVFIAAQGDVEPNLTEFNRAEVDLTRKLVSALEDSYKKHGDKIKIVPVSKVNAYLTNHPEWITQSKQSIGKHFGADYVVFLELRSMTLYEPLSGMSLYRGKAAINITTIDVNQPEGEGTKWEESYLCTYPNSNPEERGSMPPDRFRLKFYERMTKDLVRYFAYHETRDKVELD